MSIKLKDYLLLFREYDRYKKDCVDGKKGAVKSTVLTIYLADFANYNGEEWWEHPLRDQVLVKNDDEKFFDHVIVEKHTWATRWGDCKETIFIAKETLDEYLKLKKGDE